MSFGIWVSAEESASAQHIFCRKACVFAAAVFLGAYAFAGFGCARAYAAQAASPAQATGPSGLPLPRFVTLKSNRVNMRVGPSLEKYPVIWSYQRKGLPVEIVQEYDNWRRIRDSEGAMGWVNAALLSGKRAAIIAPKGASGPTGASGFVPLYAQAAAGSPVVIKAEPGVIGAIKQCDGTWCELDINKNYGYIQQNKLWGVYPREIIR